jgi:hypothetical protein
MAMWLYQLSESTWSLNNYRLDIWEGERWEWEVGRVSGTDSTPRPGDTVAFFYAPAGCKEPGFYGWAVILLWISDDKQRFYFRPVPPSDQLKMRPWWDETAKQLVDQVRGKVARGTLWPVPDELAAALGKGISQWVNG